MKVHDKYVLEIKELLNGNGVDAEIKNKVSWDMLQQSDYILDSDTYIELGSTTKESLSYSVCSTGINFEDKIVVIGEDIPKLKGKIPNYARIVFVSMEDSEDQNTLFKQIKDIERSKYNVNFAETMLRTSSFNGRECFRISKKAYKNKLDFSTIGSGIINELKSNEYVKNVQIYYIVNNATLISKLQSYPKKINILSEALNNMFDNIVLDCNICDIKEICDEVDGMREEHQKSIDRLKSK